MRQESVNEGAGAVKPRPGKGERTMTYHIGLAKRGQTLVIEARRNKDYLSCELYDYMGEREVTKQQLEERRYKILEKMKAQRPDVYGDLRYAVVD